MEPHLVGTLNFFDYDRWDKVSKPAGFNMKIPPEMQAEANRRMAAASKRIDHQVPIYNGRPVADQMALDTCGLCFQHVPTRMTKADWYDIQRVHDIYFPECIEYVKRMTGATAVLPFDHSIRNKSLAGKDGIAAYVTGAHNDNTLSSGPNRCRQLLKDGPVADEVLKHRFGVMNVWRRWDG